MSHYPLTLGRALDLSDHVFVSDFKIKETDRQGIDKVHLKTDEANDLTFVLDTTQRIELDDSGMTTVVDVEGELLPMEFMVTAPLRVPANQADDPLDEGVVSYSADGGDTWTAIMNDVRFVYPRVAECEVEEQDLLVTVTREGVVLDLIGCDSGEIAKTTCLDKDALTELLQARTAAASPEDIWNNNAVQFPRLLCEINATQDDLDMLGLAESMDVSVHAVTELFERADVAWENHKEREL